MVAENQVVGSWLVGRAGDSNDGDSMGDAQPLL